MPQLRRPVLTTSWAKGGDCRSVVSVGPGDGDTLKLGIAGWPLRRASAACIDLAFQLSRSSIVEIPKDLLDRISTKQLFSIIARSAKTPCLAATTDFARLSGLGWIDYKRYFDIQVSQARFLGCKMLRVFLQAETQIEFKVAIDRLAEVRKQMKDLEIVLETHRGWETTQGGLDFLLLQTDFRLVVDFANVRGRKVREYILSDVPKQRIAYFHIRNLPIRLERPSLAGLEHKAVEAFPDHPFLWEPKTVGGFRALETFRAQLDCCTRRRR